MKRNVLIIIFIFLIALPVLFVVLNLKGPETTITKEENLLNPAQQSNDKKEQENFSKLLYDNRKYLLENKKKFLKDILGVIPIVEERDINNSTTDTDLQSVKSERQKQYQMIQKALREADYYSLTGEIKDKTVYAYVNDKVKTILYSNYSEEEYTYYYKIEPANPQETILKDKKGYFYYVYLFTDSYEVNPADPYGDIKKLILLVEKIKDNWIITELMYNNQRLRAKNDKEAIEEIIKEIFNH